MDVFTFLALREHMPHLVPVNRLIYGSPSPIWLERSDGPLRPASITSTSLGDDLIGTVGGCDRCSLDDCSTASGFLRACKGRRGMASRHPAEEEDGSNQAPDGLGR